MSYTFFISFTSAFLVSAQNKTTTLHICVAA